MTNTTVILFSQVPLYVYAPLNLFLSWGFAILHTIFAIILGIQALAKNGHSYSNNFSTVLRTTRHLELDAVLPPKEETGSDPLPKHLAERGISLNTHIVVDSDSFESTEVRQPLTGNQNGPQDGPGKNLPLMSERRV